MCWLSPLSRNSSWYRATMNSTEASRGVSSRSAHNSNTVLVFVTTDLPREMGCSTGFAPAPTDSQTGMLTITPRTT